MHGERGVLLDDIHGESWDMAHFAGTWYIAFEALVSVLSEMAGNRVRSKSYQMTGRKTQAVEGGKAYKH